ncbi:hypothetical protein DFJ73DRAFT_956183 [Zopfochytrium polystomum]|nr:hypothetical protein DFJ73DRAFT_956183 [Zopfochytrium polystomum]
MDHSSSTRSAHGRIGARNSSSGGGSNSSTWRSELPPRQPLHVHPHAMSQAYRDSSASASSHSVGSSTVPAANDLYPSPWVDEAAAYFGDHPGFLNNSHYNSPRFGSGGGYPPPERIPYADFSARSRSATSPTRQRQYYQHQMGRSISAPFADSPYDESLAEAAYAQSAMPAHHMRGSARPPNLSPLRDGSLLNDDDPFEDDDGPDQHTSPSRGNNVERAVVTPQRRLQQQQQHQHQPPLQRNRWNFEVSVRGDDRRPPFPQPHYPYEHPRHYHEDEYHYYKNPQHVPFDDGVFAPAEEEDADGQRSVVAASRPRHTPGPHHYDGRYSPLPLRRFAPTGSHYSSALQHTFENDSTDRRPRSPYDGSYDGSHLPAELQVQARGYPRQHPPVSPRAPTSSGGGAARIVPPPADRDEEAYPKSTASPPRPPPASSYPQVIYVRSPSPAAPPQRRQPTPSEPGQPPHPQKAPPPVDEPKTARTATPSPPSAPATSHAPSAAPPGGVGVVGDDGRRRRRQDLDRVARQVPHDPAVGVLAGPMAAAAAASKTAAAAPQPPTTTSGEAESLSDGSGGNATAAAAKRKGSLAPEADEDENAVKRRRNAEAARRSRMRKLQTLEIYESRCGFLEGENARLEKQLEEYAKAMRTLQGENDELRARTMVGEIGAVEKEAVEMD